MNFIVLRRPDSSLNFNRLSGALSPLFLLKVAHLLVDRTLAYRRQDGLIVELGKPFGTGPVLGAVPLGTSAVLRGVAALLLGLNCFEKLRAREGVVWSSTDVFHIALKHLI
jgi:hypothetical protein